jgi:hypothetical protein
MSMNATYYNEARTHLSLRKNAPMGRPVEQFGRIIVDPMVGGLPPKNRGTVGRRLGVKHHADSHRS